MFIRTVVSENDVLAELLEIFVATPAIPTGIDHATDRGEIAFFEFFHIAADRDNATNNFVTRHARKRGPTPFVARRVNIGVANAAEKDVDLHIVRQGIATCEREWRER